MLNVSDEEDIIYCDSTETDEGGKETTTIKMMTPPAMLTKNEPVAVNG